MASFVSRPVGFCGLPLTRTCSRLPSPSPFLLCRFHPASSSLSASSVLPVLPLRAGSARLTCRALDGNSSSTTAEEDLKSQDSSLLPTEDEVAQKAGEQQATVNEEESVSQALRQLRQEQQQATKEDPSKLQEFWQGVLEETRLIEWPSIQKVLSTTGVVISIIVGSSLVLLTVNAVLAQLSDAFFNNSPPSV